MPSFQPPAWAAQPVDGALLQVWKDTAVVQEIPLDKVGYLIGPIYIAGCNLCIITLSESESGRAFTWI